MVFVVFVYQGFTPLPKEVRAMVHRETNLEGLRKHRAAISGPPSAANAAASASAAVAEAQAEAAAQAAETKKLGPQNGEEIVLAYRHAEGFTNAVRRPVKMSDLLF